MSRKVIEMSDELQSMIETERAAAVRLLAERDRLAADNAEMIRVIVAARKGSQSPDGVNIVDFQNVWLSQKDDEAKRLTAELAELRAACAPFVKWWQEAVDNIAPNALENAARRPIAYEGRYHGPTLGDCRRIAALLARTPEATR